MKGSCRGMFLPAAVVCALPMIGGCTVYTRPSRVSGEVGVRTVRTVEPAPAPPPPPAGAWSGGDLDDGRPASGASLSVFFQALAAAGQWIDMPVCGAYHGRVWSPDPWVVGPDFVPYRNAGRWVQTDVGWAFESDFDWGWATFHYGRWCDDARHGWVWVPGDEWAPAWVDWREGGGYVGWAPLPPRGAGVEATRWIYADASVFAQGRVPRRPLPEERVAVARRATRPVRTVVRHTGGYTWYAGPELGYDSGGEGRPVHIVPPARGQVDRVIIRRH